MYTDICAYFRGAELSDLVRIHKQVVKGLPAKMPGKWRHGLRDNFDTVPVELREAVFDPLVQGQSFRLRQCCEIRDAANIGYY